MAKTTNTVYSNKHKHKQQHKHKQNKHAHSPALVNVVVMKTLARKAKA